jgi:hypothetical protein
MSYHLRLLSSILKPQPLFPLSSPTPYPVSPRHPFSPPHSPSTQSSRRLPWLYPPLPSPWLQTQLASLPNVSSEPIDRLSNPKSIGDQRVTLVESKFLQIQEGRYQNEDLLHFHSHFRDRRWNYSIGMFLFLRQV